MGKFAIRRFVVLVFWVLGALYSGARLMLDMIGYTTAPEDFAQLQQALPYWLEWLFSTPWWVPSGLMLVLTLFVIWVSWPRRTVRAVSIEQATKEGLIDAQQLPKSEYIDTRIRLTREPGSEINYIDDEKKNIYVWQQTFVHHVLETMDGNKKTHHTDTFFFIFERPIKYKRPIINTFGQNFPSYNWVLLSDRGAVLLPNEEIPAQTFEIVFPPVEND